MIRWMLWLLAGTLLGGIVHLVAVLVLPRTATQDAYTRLARLRRSMRSPRCRSPGAERTDAVHGPAFASAVCRYDLEAGPIRLTVPISPAYTSVSFYTRRGVAYYAINDRSAGRRQIELLLMTAAQRAELRRRKTSPPPTVDRRITERHRPNRDRALAPEPGMMPVAQTVLSRAVCKPEPLPAER